MIPARQTYRVIEPASRRVAGAFRLVDAATNLPVLEPAALAVRGATVGEPQTAVAVNDRNLRISRNRSGMYVVFRAPFFDAYTSTFDQPAAPPETQSGPLRLRLGVVDAGPQYLPQEFEFDLPRSLDPSAPDSVFVPGAVPLFRAPAAPIQDGWAVLRVLVTRAGDASNTRLPGVLIRVFRSPRGVGDPAIGAGMTEWRGDTRGEALVPISGLQRFRPGAGANVFETEHPIEFEATRDNAFTGATNQLPNVARIAAGAASQLTLVSPAAPVRVRAGREHTIHLAIP
jgi:hypothetical protein